MLTDYLASPQIQSYVDTDFRANLGGGASISIKLSQTNKDLLFETPSKLIGSEFRLNEIRNILENDRRFSPHKLAFTKDNFISFLKIFESETKSLHVDESRFCGICYQWELDGACPGISCFSCGKEFHSICFSLMNNSECPYCNVEMAPVTF